MPRYEYSPTEEALLKLLPTGDKRITIKELAERFYQMRKAKELGERHNKFAKRRTPFNSRIYIDSSMRTLIKKTKANRDHRIMRSNVRPYEYWKVGK